MLRFILVCLMVGTSISSVDSKEKVKLNIFPEEYYEGNTVKMSCLFPDDSHNILEWDSMDQSLPTKRRCRIKEATCNHPDDKYVPSIVGRNITLTITNVSRTELKWICSDLKFQYSAIAKLGSKLKDNPKLKITIKKDKSSFIIETSCSSTEINITCKNDETPVDIKFSKIPESCPHPSMSFYRGRYMPKGSLNCKAQRSLETAEASAGGVSSYTYVIGGILIAIGCIINIIIIIAVHYNIIEIVSEHKITVSGIGICFILFGVGVCVYNHVFGVFVTCLILGCIVLVATIIVQNKDFLKRKFNYTKTPGQETVST